MWRSSFYALVSFVSIAVAAVYAIDKHTRNRERETARKAMWETPLGTPTRISGADLLVLDAKGELARYRGETLQLDGDVKDRTDSSTLLINTPGPSLICAYDPRSAPEGNGLTPGAQVVVTGRVGLYFPNQLWLYACRFSDRTTPLYEGWEDIKDANGNPTGVRVRTDRITPQPQSSP